MNDFFEKNKLLLNYGSLGGGVSFIGALLLYIIVGNPIGAASIVFSWLPILFIILGVKKHRDTVLDGYITYRQSLTSSFIISFVYASLFAMLFYLFGFIIDTSFIQDQALLAIEEMSKNEESFIKIFGEEKYDLALKELSNATFEKSVWAEFQSKMLLGIITSFIASFFLKKNEPFEDIE